MARFTVEMPTRADAEQVREEHPDAIHESDDRRRRTVVLEDGELTDRELDAIVAVAEAGRAEREGPGQVKLTPGELDRLDFSRGRANVPHAQSVKAIMRAEGVDDWTAHYDPTLTVDEHRDVAKRAARSDRGGQEHRAVETGPGSRLERALAEECDHARDFCSRGDPAACEYLGEACGLSEDEIDAIMLEGEEIIEADAPFTGPQYHGLETAWRSYYAAVGSIESEICRALAAFEAINSIRASAGEAPIEPRRLEELRDPDLELDDLCAPSIAGPHA